MANSLATKLLIVARSDLINHVVMTLTDTDEYLSYCGTRSTTLPLGTWKHVVENNSVARARLCQKCLKRMDILGITLPDALPVGWHERPWGLG